MDLEAVQFLNLSPILELSETELSTMLEQLSGLSDLNGDLTDRNVEDILKEAEDLLDKSYNSGMNQSISLMTNSEPSDMPVIKETELNECVKMGDSNQTKHLNTPVKAEDVSKVNTSGEISNSSDQIPNRIFSPGNSTNHIKSTIDSLKEFSNLIEKQLSSRSESSSKENSARTKMEFESEEACSEKTKTSPKLKARKKMEFESEEACSQKTKTSPKSILKSPQSKGSEIKKKDTESVNMDKSIKMLNCFERLYQDRPVRLSTTCKKPKITDKVTKTIVKKKPKDVKGLTKDRYQVSKISDKFKLNTNIKGKQELTDIEPDYTIQEWLSISKVSGHTFSRSHLLENKTSKNEESEPEKSHSVQTGSKMTDGKLIMTLLQEMKQGKDQERIGGVGKCGEVPEEVLRDNQAVIDSLRSGVEYVKEKVTSESLKTTGIQRLEEQFSVLKNKYDQHVEKLEAENLKLREALNSQQRSCPVRVTASCEISTVPEVGTSTDDLTIVAPGIPSSSKPTENIKVPENSPVSNNSSRSSPSSSPKQTAVKEAFTQTEKELRNISIQCVEEEKGTSEDGASQTDYTVEEKRGVAKTMENKENVSLNKKQGKCRPFTDVNVHQLLKQKKVISDHETQLLATLRGLQAEVTLKDKETRKLKAEIDLLRNQMRKQTRSKGDNCKKCHTGTQTINLGPIVQRPYNPEVYEETPNEFEKENEELRLRVKALEEDFQFLKEKRVTDLQALHQVHEEEMAKLVSKLETQSALTRHLHSLLVSR